jgi:hypothetical protein
VEKENKMKKESIEIPQFREITITPGVSGFKVKIGCSEVYFSGWNDLLCELTKYYKNPHKTEEYYLLCDHRKKDTQWGTGAIGVLSGGNISFTNTPVPGTWATVAPT